VGPGEDEDRPDPGEGAEHPGADPGTAGSGAVHGSHAPAAGNAATSGSAPTDGTRADGNGAAETSPWSAPAWEPATVPAGGPPEGPRPVSGATSHIASPVAPTAGRPDQGLPAPTGTPPPRRGRAAVPERTHRWGLGAYLLVEAVFLLASLAVGALVGAGGPPGAGGLAVALAVPTVLAAGTALLITRLRGNGPRADLRLLGSWRDVGLGVAFGVGGLAVTIPASVLFVAIAGADATSAVGEVFGGATASPALAVVIFLIVVLVAPFCEEVVYRGLLWGGVERLAGPKVAFAVSTLLFALAHFEFTRTPLLLVVAIPIAAARYFTGRLTASIIAHQINNLLPGAVLALGLLGVLPTG
jgi:CAAX protease family protein